MVGLRTQLFGSPANVLQLCPRQGFFSRYWQHQHPASWNLALSCAVLYRGISITLYFSTLRVGLSANHYFSKQTTFFHTPSPAFAKAFKLVITFGTLFSLIPSPACVFSTSPPKTLTLHYSIHLSHVLLSNAPLPTEMDTQLLAAKIVLFDGAF